MPTIEFPLACSACGESLTGVDLLGHCPRCGRAVARTLDLERINQANVTVSCDVPCIVCGYNLRTRPLVAVCPECAAPVRLSLRFSDLRAAGKPWQHLVYVGVTLLLAFLLIGFIPTEDFAVDGVRGPVCCQIPAAILLVLANSVFGDETVREVLGLCLVASQVSVYLWGVAVFCATATDRDGPSLGPRPKSLGIARLCAGTLLVLVATPRLCGYIYAAIVTWKSPLVFSEAAEATARLLSPPWFTVSLVEVLLGIGFGAMFARLAGLLRCDDQERAAGFADVLAGFAIVWAAVAFGELVMRGVIPQVYPFRPAPEALVRSWLEGSMPYRMLVGLVLQLPQSICYLAGIVVVVKTRRAFGTALAVHGGGCTTRGADEGTSA